MRIPKIVRLQPEYERAGFFWNYYNLIFFKLIDLCPFFDIKLPYLKKYKKRFLVDF